MRSDELAELMQEPPGGENHGRRASDNPEVEGRHLSMDASEWQAAEFMRAGGFTAITHVPGTEQRGGSWQAAGGTTHRGVLRGDEYIDHRRLVGLVEYELGFSFDEVHAVYRQGRLSDTQRELRGQIDARLLALSRSGASMALLGRVLGFQVKADDHCRVMENALTRAQAADSTSTAKEAL